MRRDWLLVETLGPRLTLVAQGRQLRKYVSLTSFLNRNPFATEIWAAVAATHRSGRGSVVSSTSGDRLIHTAPVTMTDQRVHGVQVWCGRCSTQPPDRPLIGAVVWDLTTGIATNTREALLNSGFDEGTESTHGRAFAEDLAPGELHADEGKSLAQIIKCQPGERFCSTWDVAAYDGERISVSFTAYAALERWPDGTEHLVARAMNWRARREPHSASSPSLAQQIINGTAQHGVHRALVDLRTWNLLKWLDAPCPHFDWRPAEPGRPLVHPEDAHQLAAMVRRCVNHPAEGVIRLRRQRGWVRIHITMYRIQLEKDVFAGLISTRLPTPADLQYDGHLRPN